MSEAGSVGGTALCAWCESSLDERATRLKGRTICWRCGVATTTPWPTDEELAAAYSGWYRPTAGRFGKYGDALFNLVRGNRSGAIHEVAPAGSILDVGAGEGTLVDALRGLGREAVGLDPYTNRSDFLRKEAEQISGNWAAIIFWHSLEHLRAPTKTLRAAAKALEPGGVLMIAIPNASSLQARVFGDRWFPLDLPRHLVHVPAETLLEFVPRLGLEVTRVSYVKGGQIVFGWLHGMASSVSPRFDLYDALRIPEARSRPMSLVTRAMTLALGVVLFPLACVASIVEILARRGGTLYVEATAPRGAT